MQRARDFEVLSPKWDVFIKPLPQGSGTYAEEDMERLLEAEVVDDSKEIVSSRHNRTDAHTNPQRLEVSQVKAAQGPSLRRGSGHRVPSLTKKLCAVDTCWERETQFSPMKYHWVYQPYFRIGPMSEVEGQHK